MIKKVYRLKESEVKKVLKYKKPFFSYNIVANYIQNDKPYNRFAIIISKKSTKNAVERNYYRRMIYREVAKYINTPKNLEIVFVIKKQIKLDSKNLEINKSLTRDLNFILKKLTK